MPPDDPRAPNPTGDGLTRRGFLQAGSVAGLGLGLPKGRPVDETSAILLFLVGGPSHVDTFDPKPDAPSDVRGPFRPIATNVPGVAVTELFPRLARVADKVSFVRSVHHEAAAVHETGRQLMQTGRLASAGAEPPHFGSVLAKLRGDRGALPAHVVLPSPMATTGGRMPQGQTGGDLGPGFDPRAVRPASDDPDAPWLGLGGSPAAREAMDLRGEPERLRDRYGRTRFGRSCLLARRLVERGVRFVTVNMFETVFDAPSWDAHGSPPFATLGDYRAVAGPAFDAAYSTLIEDLSARGRLGSTVVLAFGEFGRTPRLNAAGGRDHHPACWTALFAGGPFRGGRVVGASDAIGYAPRDRPVSPPEIAATVYRGLGVDPSTEIPGPAGAQVRLVEPGARPVAELF